ncbi:hypothetical protein V5O48_004916 [Marasmius crinis-equi]|uniref:Structure-specific endonuclease subunit SLX4 n=1 Tax=Marasmius crinis-equi TaxID=585013 RepID=A0ABR3FP92_9AGAR
MPRYDILDDYVEDSEPEREAIRRASSSKPTTRDSESSAPSTKSFKPPCATQKPSVVEDLDIIEISDDSITVPKPQKTRREPREVSSFIELSSSSLSSILPLPPRNKKAIATPTSPVVSPPPAIATSDNTPEDNDLPSDDESPSLSLLRFTFNPTKGKGGASTSRPLLSSRPFTTSAPTSKTSSDPKVTIKPSKKEGGGSHRFSDDFSDAELAGLLKCVVCDIKWTVRKNAPQKITHVQSCAKKNGLTDDTIRKLIRKELDTTPLPPVDKGKAKAPPEAQPTTVLAEIVQDAAPKKRIKRQEVVMTVKSLGETRSAILDRAQSLLAQSNSNFRALHQNSDRLLAEGLTTDASPSTPEFGRSYLARTRGSKQPMLDSPHTPDTHQGPVFPTLNHSSTLLPNILTLSDAPNKDAVTMTPQKNTPGALPLVYISSSSSDSSPPYPKSTNAVRPSPSFRPETPISEFDYPQEEEFDDAYIRYSPIPQIVTSSNPAPLWEDDRAPSDTLDPSTPASKTKRSVSPAKTTKRRRKPAGKGKEPEVQFDEAWEEQMRNKILADKELHLRILRYEPIPFKTFVDFTTEDDTHLNGKLKLALRQFLDKQAIIFYDEDNIGRRR